MTGPGVVMRMVRLVECGGAVEEPSGLWHIARSWSVTYCGDDCDDWPRVARAVERRGIWCGPCLMTAAAEVSQSPDSEEGGRKPA